MLVPTEELSLIDENFFDKFYTFIEDFSVYPTCRNINKALSND